MSIPNLPLLRSNPSKKQVSTRGPRARLRVLASLLPFFPCCRSRSVLALSGLPGSQTAHGRCPGPLRSAKEAELTGAAGAPCCRTLAAFSSGPRFCSCRLILTENRACRFDFSPCLLGAVYCPTPVSPYQCTYRICAIPRIHSRNPFSNLARCRPLNLSLCFPRGRMGNCATFGRNVGRVMACGDLSPEALHPPR